MKYIQKIIVSGYFLIVLLIGGIAYIWHDEWQAVETLEIGNQQIDEFRKSVNHIHIRLIEFSLLGETILEWDDKDLEHYHIQRMTMDSMLCRFKNTYPSERIDSVRYLLEDKERQMSQIIRLPAEYRLSHRKVFKSNPRNPNEKGSWVSSERKGK